MSLFTNSFRLIITPVLRNISTYKSSVSLSHLYPKSSLSINYPVKIPENSTGFSGYIPIEKLEITYCKSSGPGGQNVNKVDTKVDIRFHLQSADWLSEDLKKNISSKCKNRINKDGFLIVRSDKTRSQLYNQADAIMLLREMIRRAATPTSISPSEETLHLLRKRREKANRERIVEKRMHSLKKGRRRDDIEIL
ncbi:large ribosomal subunit protein mL62 [Rhodnius prolixus]|uniref:Large ribosomal subunit protein mL62 n=2 Tax=Rhodnius TaxID=13248 RepID=T1HHC0_RHOPR